MLEKIDVMLDASVTDPNKPDRDRGTAIKPVRTHKTDAGLDLFSPSFAVIPPHGYKAIEVGVHILIPDGYAGLIKSRSSMNLQGISCEGVVDAGFVGSVRVVLTNHSDRPYNVYTGDRIAQLLIISVETPEPVLVDEMPFTDRGESGFGSSGR